MREIRESSALRMAMVSPTGQVILAEIEAVLMEKLKIIAQAKDPDPAWLQGRQGETRGVLDVLDRLGTKAVTGVGKAAKLAAQAALRRTG